MKSIVKVSWRENIVVLHSYHEVYIVCMSVSGALPYDTLDIVWPRFFVSNMLRYESHDTN